MICIFLNHLFPYIRKRRIKLDTLHSKQVWVSEKCIMQIGIPFLLFVVFGAFAVLFASMFSKGVQMTIGIVLLFVLVVIMRRLYLFFKLPTFVFADEKLFLYRFWLWKIVSRHYRIDELNRLETVKSKNIIVILTDLSEKRIAKIPLEYYDKTDEFLEQLRRIPEKE